MATAKKAVKAARPAKKATAKKTPVKATPAKAPVKAAAKAPAKAPAPAAPAAKPPKAKKPKLVRDSFTIPKTEYAVLDALKQRAAKAGLPAKKSEVLRAGVKALAAMSEAAFAAAMGAVPALKTGRPAKG